VTNAASGQSFVLGTVDNSRPDILDDDNDGDECDGTPGSEDICVNLNDPLVGDSPVDLGGRISLILIDFCSGGPADLNLGFGLFDNVVVTTASFASDFDGDGDVDGDDLDDWESDYGITDGMALKSQGDANGDGNVTGADFIIWQQESGSGVPSSAIAASTVPETSSVALLLVAALVAGCRRV